MKIIHMNKLGAVMEMKFRALFSKNFISMPIFALGFALVMKWVYGSIMSKEGISDELGEVRVSLDTPLLRHAGKFGN